MSDNSFDFTTPRKPTAPQAGFASVGPPKIPGLLLAVCIITLLLALGELFGGMVGAFRMAVVGVVMNAAGSAGATTDPQLVEILELQQAQMIPSFVIIVLNFLAAPLLIAGAIAVLAKRRWARKTLRFAFVFGMISALMEAALMVYMQITSARTMFEQVGSNQKAPPELVRLWESLAYFGIAAMSLGFVALSIAYLFGFIYLRTKSVNQYCQTFE